MMKVVRYNGEKESYYGCSSASNLKKGKMYLVESIRAMDYQTNYALKGVAGEYNSCWFEEPQSYIAIGYEIPEVGKSFECTRFDGYRKFEPIRTSTVQNVLKVGNVYVTCTENSVYLVQLQHK